MADRKTDENIWQIERECKGRKHLKKTRKEKERPPFAEDRS